MDTRRLNTGQVLAAGILGRPTPDADVPKDREEVRVDIDELDEQTLVAALERGAVIDCAEYYGIPIVWKDGDEFRGVLLQYRDVTERLTWLDANAAIDWFVDTARSVAG